ncbi:MAG: hypothetical protein ACKO33_02820 [Bacteroidota bacterium]|nr:hypothetical protein [Bacteroidota bacterium]
MKKLAKLFALAGLFALTLLHEHSFGQRIIYSDPEKDDNRRLNFEIIGRVGGNFLVFKNNRARSWITVMDEEMQVTAKEELGYLPNPDKTINVDFFAYPEHIWMIYQYERKNIVYCMAAKLDRMGRRMGELIELDTTQVGFASDNRLYAVTGSEDKRKIAVTKINTRDRGLYRVSSLLFNDKMDLIRKDLLYIPIEDRTVQLGDIEIDNEGSLVLTRFQRTFNDNISNASLLYLKPGVDTLVEYRLSIAGKWLDNLRIKIDNYNKRYILTSLFSQERRGGIDGYYLLVYNKSQSTPQVEQLYTFSDQIRQEAKGNATTKTAFNDYFIRHLITRRDGGLLIGSESYYTTSRANTWNRWDYLYGSPFWGMNNFYISPYSNRMWWGSMPRNQQAVRYHADNILIQSFSPVGELEWSQVISKSQFDDETDDLLSFQLMNTGGELHVLYNQQERRDKLLSDLTIQATGQSARNPALKNLDNGHQFMPARGKQVSSRIMIVPTVYRGYICFAKVEYN